MTDCPHCAAARDRWTWGGYHALCDGCRVRLIAHSFEFFESRRRGSLTAAYRTRLGQAFGEQWHAGHERVKAEAKRIEQLRASARKAAVVDH